MEQPSMAHLEATHPGPEFDVLQQQMFLQARIFLEQGQRYDGLCVSQHDFLERFRSNMEAIASEAEEIRDRLPWKHWKWEHRTRVADRAPLSEDERLEIKYELVDMFHFMLNIMIGAGFTSWHEVESYYFAKNKENLDRQERGY